MRVIVFLMFSMLSMSVLAHSGHGETSMLSHDLEHGIWMFAGIILLSVTALAVFKRQ